MNSRGLAGILVMLFFPSAMFAVSPLVTDDADTVEQGHLQLNAGWQLARTGSVSLWSIPVNPVLGIHPRWELGATFGYQWQTGTTRAEGITDLALATKWRLLNSEDKNLKLSARFDLKVPTASADRSLGTGKTDVGSVLIATRCWGSTCLDSNVGYSANDLSRSVFNDDHWFLGQAVRQELSQRWTLIGETYALLPHSGEGGSVNVHLRAGAQLTIRENFVVSALIGSAAGDDSPDLTSYLGLTLMY
jgi:Putative MetA-pathway of phenol degradation